MPGHRCVRRNLCAAALSCALPLLSCAVAANAAQPGAHASTASTSRWWKLECEEAARGPRADPKACVFTVRLHGLIDGSRLQLVRRAVERRDAVRRALGREVDLHVDVDSPGGEIFSTLEIGRTLRAEQASIAVGRGAACVSSCVFLIMGAVERHISHSARLGIHRPSLAGPLAGEPRHASEDEIVDALAEQLVLYAQQMNVPRKIVDTMMSVPADRVQRLSASQLAGYGIHPVDPLASKKRGGGARS